MTSLQLRKVKVAGGCICIVTCVMGVAMRPVARAEENTANSVIRSTTDPVIITLLGGMKMRSKSLTNVSGYAVTDFYSTSDATVREAPDEIVVQNSLKHPNELKHLFFAYDGARMREDEKTAIPESANYYRLAADDGNRLQVWDFGRPTAAEYSSDKAPSYLGQSSYALQLPFGRNGDSFVHDIESRKTRFMGKENIGGIETYRLQAEPSEGGVSVDDWWIAPSRGFLVLKHEFRNSKPNPGQRIASWRHVEIVDRVLKVGTNLYVPGTTRHNIYLTLKGVAKKELWVSLNRYSVISIKVNDSVPSQLFELPLPLGTKVGTVGILKDSYTVGGSIASAEKSVSTAEVDRQATRDIPLNNKVDDN